MNYVARVTRTYLGRTLVLSALLLIACAVLWAARDQALTARENSTSTEQPAGPAGSAALEPAATPPAASPSATANTPASTPRTQHPKAAAVPQDDPVTTTTPPVATVTTNPHTGDVGPATGPTEPDTNTPVVTTPAEVCHVAGCPGA